MTELSPLAPGVHAWLADEPAHGHANAGVIVDADGITIVDALAVPSQYEPFADAVDAIGMPIKRLVLTSSNAEYGRRRRLPARRDLRAHAGISAPRSAR